MKTKTILPELVGTLAALPENTQKTIKAYGSACYRTALQSPEIQALKDALRELISIVEIHSSVTKNNFAWAELDEAKSAIAAMEQK